MQPFALQHNSIAEIPHTPPENTSNITERSQRQLSTSLALHNLKHSNLANYSKCSTHGHPSARQLLIRFLSLCGVQMSPCRLCVTWVLRVFLFQGDENISINTEILLIPSEHLSAWKGDLPFDCDSSAGEIRTQINGLPFRKDISVRPKALRTLDFQI